MVGSLVFVVTPLGAFVNEAPESAGKAPVNLLADNPSIFALVTELSKIFAPVILLLFGSLIILSLPLIATTLTPVSGAVVNVSVFPDKVYSVPGV